MFHETPTEEFCRRLEENLKLSVDKIINDNFDIVRIQLLCNNKVISEGSVLLERKNGQG